MTTLPGRRSTWVRRPTPRLVLGLFVLSGPAWATAQEVTPAASPADTPGAATKSPEQLQSLVAPIALYPDDLLAQVLAASTYPLEIIQLQQWMSRHPDLKDEALADSVAQQPWDPSVQSMAALPDALNRLADDIQWTTELGNAFLAQGSDVMEAVQVMRGQAQGQGALESTEQQTVETQVVENTTVIVIESTDPEIIYVPSYDPHVVYPPPVYAYPPIYYPPYYPGQAFISFSFGFFMGAAIWGGSCCHAGWGGNTVIINNNNNFNRNVDRERNVNRGDGGRGDSWQHNPSHRGGTPYGDRATAERFGGSDRASAGTRDVSGQRAGAAGGAGVSNRAAGAGGRPAVSSQPSTARSGQSIGNRSIPSGRQSGGFSGGSRGYSGGSARASSSRGRSSFGGGSRGRGRGR
jgi:hypothetical protein